MRFPGNGFYRCPGQPALAQQMGRTSMLRQKTRFAGRANKVLGKGSSGMRGTLAANQPR
jgi:hypothetical protein